jgi:signal transduction histidine kinase
MVREIVLLHGGHVSVADGPDGGACFRMTLPPKRQS